MQDILQIVQIIDAGSTPTASAIYIERNHKVKLISLFYMISHRYTQTFIYIHSSIIVEILFFIKFREKSCELL